MGWTENTEVLWSDDKEVIGFIVNGEHFSPIEFEIRNKLTTAAMMPSTSSGDVNLRIKALEEELPSHKYFHLQAKILIEIIKARIKKIRLDHCIK